jgi:PAS domain S-box-containing protein
MRAEVIDSRRSHVFEGARVRKDGSIFYASTMVSAVIDARGEVVGVSAITHDLTARIEAEEAMRRAHASEQRLRVEIEQSRNELRASEIKFRTLAEALPQIVWITRPDGWNTYFNEQWFTYTGMTAEESCGHGWNLPFHPDDRQRAWDAWQRAVQTDGVYELECRIRRADGVYRWWLIRGVSLHDGSGNVSNWFGTCTDVEDIKQTEERLIASEERFRLALDDAPIGMARIRTMSPMRPRSAPS